MNTRERGDDTTLTIQHDSDRQEDTTPVEPPGGQRPAIREHARRLAAQMAPPTPEEVTDAAALRHRIRARQRRTAPGG